MLVVRWYDVPIESQDIFCRLTQPMPWRRPEGTVISKHFSILAQSEQIFISKDMMIKPLETVMRGMENQLGHISIYACCRNVIIVLRGR